MNGLSSLCLGETNCGMSNFYAVGRGFVVIWKVSVVRWPKPGIVGVCRQHKIVPVWQDLRAAAREGGED